MVNLLFPPLYYKSPNLLTNASPDYSEKFHVSIKHTIFQKRYYLNNNNFHILYI